MEQLLNTLKGLQGQVISDDLLQQLQATMAASQAAKQEQSYARYSDDKPLIIDGETEMDDILVAQKVAMMETAAMKTEWAPVIQQQSIKVLDGLANEIFSDSEDDIETITPESSARSSLDKLLAENGLREVDRESSIGDDEVQDLPLDFDISNLPTHLSLYEPLIPVGEVYSQVEGMLVVRGLQVALDERSLVCFSDSTDRQVIGMILETFGAVQQPSYLVAVTNKAAIAERQCIGANLSTIPSHSKLILLDEENGVFSIAGQTDREDQLEWGGDCSGDEEPVAVQKSSSVAVQKSSVSFKWT